jgi:hypothetical protein
MPLISPECLTSILNQDSSIRSVTTVEIAGRLETPDPGVSFVDLTFSPVNAPSLRPMGHA